MNVTNAIAKIRFASARAQRVQLHKGKGILVDLICVEPGQELQVASGEWAYYVITGTAKVAAGGTETPLPTGQLAAADANEKHALVNDGEQRLVCLAVGAGH